MMDKVLKYRFWRKLRLKSVGYHLGHVNKLRILFVDVMDNFKESLFYEGQMESNGFGAPSNLQISPI